MDRATQLILDLLALSLWGVRITLKASNLCAKGGSNLSWGEISKTRASKEVGTFIASGASLFGPGPKSSGDETGKRVGLIKS